MSESDNSGSGWECPDASDDMLLLNSSKMGNSTIMGASTSIDNSTNYVEKSMQPDAAQSESKWVFVQHFDDRFEAELELTKEKTWTMRTRSKKRNVGTKAFYRCSKATTYKPCKAAAYLFYAVNSSIVTLFRSIIRHSCDGGNPKYNAVTKFSEDSCVC